MREEITSYIAVLGAGPGGYTAAFRAADLLQGTNKKVILIEKEKTLGGVCLNVGCIPSKTLLNITHLLREVGELNKCGFEANFKLTSLDGLRNKKNEVINKLTSGLSYLAKQRDVEVIQGDASFVNSHQMVVETQHGSTLVNFEKIIIACGSRPIVLPFLPKDERIMDSTGALELKDIPKRLLIIGGGIIGVEMACIYSGLGSEVTIVEMAPSLLPMIDKDLIQAFLKHQGSHLKQPLLNTKVLNVQPHAEHLEVSFDTQGVQRTEHFDKILVAIGRKPNTDVIGIEKSGLSLSPQGFIPVNEQMQTNIPHIFAIGDCIGQPMLAHKAIPEGKVAAEVACGLKSFFVAKYIPNVVYTDPEIAWVGATEEELIKKSTPYKKGVFPWAASGRSLAMGRQEGLTKLLFNPDTHEVLGAGIVGIHAGDLIGEVTLGMEFSCVAQDISLTIHPHPTLIETLAQACEVFEGTNTDLPPIKK